MSTDILFRILFGVLLLFTMAVASMYRVKAEPAGGMVSAKEARQQEGLFIYLGLRLMGVAVWLGALLYVVAPSLFAWSRMPLPMWARWLGVGLALAAIPLVIWAQRSLGANVTKTVVTKREHTLVTHGPYRWVRNPLYLAGVVFFIALSLIGATWYFVAAIGLGAIPLIARTRLEEAALLARFGEPYREYMNRTGRFFPRLIG